MSCEPLQYIIAVASILFLIDAKGMQHKVDFSEEI